MKRTLLPIKSTAEPIISAAYLSGRRAALEGQSPSPPPSVLPGTAEHIEWLRGYQSVQNQRAADRAFRLTSVVSLCRYQHPRAPCDCGGRGLCLDVA